MGEIKVNRLTNANVYMDGKSFLGRAEEIELPKITQVMAEHSALGMIGKFEFPAGVDKMEAKIKWNSFYADAITAVADPTKSVQLQVRSSLETYSATGRDGQTPCVVHIVGSFKSLPTGMFKQHENVDLESDLNVTYVKVEIGGVSLVEFDALANIYKVNGVDIAATYRQNIGQ